MHNAPGTPLYPTLSTTSTPALMIRDTSPSTRFTPPPPGEEPLRVTAAEVRRTLQRINPRKAAGPDNISGRVLKGCAYQLTEVLTDIFNTSLQQAAVPTCLLPEDRHDHPHPHPQNAHSDRPE
ncbi:hypothetical protein L3Q82_000411 [Scortum barcoo]|uniref:Uncharacterized protein n=1 Tax=Scortum barcoo TaxID=214431 RepID=A0ACB8X9W9_9TELE|nr:hypothetical protein L3Q82_000411 [Scortum barcoo]